MGKVAAVKANTPAHDLAAKIDEYGELKRQEQIYDPIAKRLAQLREEFNTLTAGEPEDQPVTLQGNLYILQLTPKQNQREIVSMAKLFTAIGRTPFLRLCRFPISAIDDLKVPAGLVKTERTGSRQITAVARQKVA